MSAPASILPLLRRRYSGRELATRLRQLADTHEAEANRLLTRAAELRGEATAVQATAERAEGIIHLGQLQPGDRVRDHWTVERTTVGTADGRVYAMGRADDGTPFTISGVATTPLRATRPQEVTQ